MGRAARKLESWHLFWVLAFLISAVDGVGLARANLHTARGTVPVILLAVRCALPCFVIAFSASSLAILWPGRPTRWLLANRRYFGLAFAFGMAWHLSFVGYLFASFGNPLNATVITLDLIGVSFLLALSLTSFRWMSRRMSARSWKRLHKTGVYAIWLLATYIYAESVRGGWDVLHLTALVVLMAAWTLRVAATVEVRYGGAGHRLIGPSPSPRLRCQSASGGVSAASAGERAKMKFDGPSM